MRLRLGTASNGGDSVYLLDGTNGWVCLVDAAKKRKWAHDPAALTSVVAFLGLDQQGRADARAMIRGVPGLKIMDERLPLEAISLRDAALYVEHMAQATKGFVGIALRCGHAVQLLLGHVLGKKLRLPRALGPCAAPAYYVGNPRTIIPSGAQARWPSYAGILDYELEVALILGSNLEVDADETTCAAAVQHHGGFVLINDFSARDVQADEMTSVGFGFVKCKAFCTSMGSEVVTADELYRSDESGRLFGDGLACEVLVDGERWSSGRTSAQKFCSLSQYVEHCCRGEGLGAGEVLGMGTVPNCCGLELGRFLEPGCTVEVRCEELGSVRNVVAGSPGANFRDLGRAAGQPSRLATALKFLGMAFIAPVVVFIALLGGAIAALAWPGPPVRKDKKD